MQIISHDPHAPLFAKALSGAFPGKVANTQCELLDLITGEIVANKNIRLGPSPSPEILVNIRDVIRHYMAQHKPIPFMVPWGSEKPDGGGVDLAEVAALQTIRCLNSRVQEHYPAGIVANIRLEDVSAPHLFFFRAEEAAKEAEVYTNGFRTLVMLLGLEQIVQPRPESTLITRKAFEKEADNLLEVVEPYLKAFLTDSAETALYEAAKERGMSSPFSLPVISHYLEQTGKMYVNETDEFKVHMVARYFSAAIARHKLKIRGDDPDWENKFIDLSFVAPIRGTTNHFGRRVYYHTTPANVTANHIPPWRAKGYFQLSSDGDSACIKLASFNHLPEDLVPHVIEFRDDTATLEVTADYIM